MSFLTNKYGPLPAWGWGALAGGSLLVMKMAAGGSGGRPRHSNEPFDISAETEARITAGQNTGAVSAVTNFGYGPLDSKINGSFFGNGVVELQGPSSIGWDGIEHYVDIFPVGMGGRARTVSGVPTGAGGIGTHGPRWQGEAPPAGGEGYQNYGQGTGPHKGVGGRPVGLNFSEHHHGGGGPHPQKTTMGAPIGTYMSQHGDNFDNVANKMWGPGQNGTLIHQANPGIAGSPQDPMHAGHMLNIPGAPPVGLAPSGVAGNGVGGGSWTGSTRARGMGAQGMHHVGMDPDLHTAGTMGERPRPGKAGHGKRRGRGIQKARS